MVNDTYKKRLIILLALSISIFFGGLLVFLLAGTLVNFLLYGVIGGNDILLIIINLGLATIVSFLTFKTLKPLFLEKLINEKD